MSTSTVSFKQEIQEPCEDLLQALNQLETHLQPLVGHPTLGDYLSTVSEADRVNLGLMRSRLLTQLYYMYCSVNALDVKEHEVIDELKRLDIYEGKLQSIKKQAKQPASDAESAATSISTPPSLSSSSSASTSTSTSSSTSSSTSTSSGRSNQKSPKQSQAKRTRR